MPTSDIDPELLRLINEVSASLAEGTPFQLRYGTIAEPLREIPQAISNRIRRDRSLYGQLASRHTMLPATVDYMVRVSATTWQTILFISLDEQACGRRVEFMSTIPVLARSILDALCSLLYLFDEATANCRRFIVSGWAKGMAHHAKMQARYGADPGSELWLRAFLVSTRNLERMVTLTDAERNDLKGTGWWPVPGKMKFRDPKREALRDLLSGLFYGDLSEDSHLSFPGLVRRSGLLDTAMPGVPDIDPQRYRNSVIVPGLTIFLSLLSEVAGELHLDHEKGRLREVWAKIIANPEWHEPNVLYKERYEEWLR